MIPDQMDGNALNSRLEIRERAARNDGRRRLSGQDLQRVANGLRQDGRIPVLNDARQRAVKIKSKQDPGLPRNSIEHSLAWGSEHILHEGGYRARPEACPTCFITRMRRRIRAASMSMRPAQR